VTLIDTHTHVIAGDETRYPLRPSGVGSDWYREAPCTVEELAALTAGAGVDAAVLVQAFGPYADDNSYVVDAAAAYPGRFVSVVVVDAEHPDAPARLRALADEPGVTGVRLFCIGPLDRPQPTWLDDPATFGVWESCAALELRVVVACLPEHLARLRRMVARFPDQAVVLDHCGFVDFGEQPDDLYALAAFPNLYCKVTSHVLEAADAAGRAAEVVGRLVAEFGAPRLVWGSDFPQTHDRPYRELVALARRACAELSDDDRAQLLGGTARALWPQLGA